MTLASGLVYCIKHLISHENGNCGFVFVNILLQGRADELDICKYVTDRHGLYTHPEK